MWRLKHTLTNNPCIPILNHFISELNLTLGDIKYGDNVLQTYFHACGASSIIDHFAVSTAMLNEINKLDVIDSGLNLCVHRPVVISNSLNVAVSRSEHAEAAQLSCVQITLG